MPHLRWDRATSAPAPTAQLERRFFEAAADGCLDQEQFVKVFQKVLRAALAGYSGSVLYRRQSREHAVISH